ncbi:MAG: hypothetical protein ACUVRR_13155 [Candidatus Fervidibacter sp.]|uniref:hypothetical protein n=1 Tax=Candidatus Fervidibacter sp. TaxID=3100871 RepID=UPI00404976B6
MKQQWQQMPQKKLAIVLLVVIVLALILIAWQLIPKGPSTTPTHQEVALQPAPTHMQGPMHGVGGPATEMAAHGAMGAAGMGAPPEAMGQVTAPMTPGGGLTAGVPTLGAPEAGAPTPTPPGKLENPPRPGRPDPFADLPPPGKATPFTPIVLPPSPEPVTIVRAKAGSIGTEPFSLQNPETNIPPIQAHTVDLRSYFAPPQPIRTVRELSGWRLSGTILTEGSIGAIIQTPDGRTRAVRLGDRVSFGGMEYTITQVDEQKVSLKDSRGEEYTLSRRPSPIQPMVYITPGGFAPGFGTWGGAPSGWGPGGFGPGGFAPGGFGPGGFGPGGY